ncbi:hypothetical protein A8709_26760 [Paenibacillus pectinilyticus]|uniref:ATP-dependent DNA ligase family profile domain-containing protein n=2 Tax=Paenibacillus pectinilyticus TaxID=512399 RepID=A0A1C1A1K5_9BACL|nr:hypothetical protein A8709_26760 [Paenibacillus pectinilyticus]
MFISPMLLQYSKNNLAFDDSSTFDELKWDVIRLIVSNLDELNLKTKNTNSTAKYPELHNPPIPKGTILDGEIVVLDEKGRADFESHWKNIIHRILDVIIVTLGMYPLFL